MKLVRSTIQIAALCLAVHASLLLAPVRAHETTSSVFPGEAWAYVGKDDLKAYGWSPEVLDETTSFIREESNTTGLVVVDRGRVVYQFGDIEELSYVASVRKSILACSTVSGWSTGSSTSTGRSQTWGSMTSVASSP